MSNFIRGFISAKHIYRVKTELSVCIIPYILLTFLFLSLLNNILYNNNNIFPGMIVSAIITSVYSIGLISVDRYLYIVYGLQYQRYIYPLRARIMIISTWILGMYILENYTKL